MRARRRAVRRWPGELTLAIGLGIVVTQRLGGGQFDQARRTAFMALAGVGVIAWDSVESGNMFGILVALKDRLNALKNPYAHLHEPEISYDSIKESFMLWEPIRYAETCPSSDGAFAMVLGSEAAAEASAASSARWVGRDASCTKPWSASS